ncbi:hypothetical protein PR202_ga07636 [Eleusine coracana subsp. coracana]|uniref:phospholipase D n=1 Tax=Eleusine coracana subsp. coracana TaxID=191504 RepID=A0AAV5BY64_ELECO|nr:hypothetical protein PR202_ga07636 [Eleusine coracana subsp. coracana]
MEGGGGHGQHPPHYPPYQPQYPPQQPQPYPYGGYQYPPPASAAPPPHYLSPSPSFPGYSPAPPPQQPFAHHSGPLQPYPPPPQTHAYPPPPAPSSYAHGYEPYPSSAPSYPSQSTSSALSPSSSFRQNHHHAPGPEPPSPAPSTPSYPIEDVLATMRLSGRHDYPSSPSLPPPPAAFSASGSSHGGGMQVVPYGGGGGSQHGSVRPSLKVVLLHGTLDMWVHDARSLPNKDMFSKSIGDLLGPRITSAVGSKMSSAAMTSDPYVTIQVSTATIARTYVVSNNENPVWEQHFLVPVGHEAAEVQFVVKDSDVFGAQIIGAVAIPAEKLLSGERIEGVYPVLEPNGKPCAPGAVLRLSIQFIPVARLTSYHHGVVAGPDCHGVPNTYFPLRRGMKVTLYQDAHVPDGCLPDIWLDHGLRYQHGQCWRDIYDAICQARKFIYIVGWSVFHTIHLMRDGAQVPSLGDLLKMKSQEGVRVLLLVWDDPTSRSILGFKTDGFMGTRDEEAQIFQAFFSSSVALSTICWEATQLGETTESGLWKNVLIDMSIHTAYVHAIRAAQHFLYIENQYFIGSSFNWDSHKDLGANNLIPIEIALKIANKIKANERFSAYIVIPMWPEGNPTGAATQRILYWQNKTMQMMYETIYRALKEAGLDEIYEPQDYLNFFCLGNREVPDSTSMSNASNNPQEQARKNRRFMVYVHSKGMIVDDEYVIIGSANVNQRSMEGIRDTEIAMGAYQPQYTWANKVSAPSRTGADSITATDASEESLECMRQVRHLGEENWKQFIADDVTEMKGHLMKYPVDAINSNYVSLWIKASENHVMDVETYMVMFGVKGVLQPGCSFFVPAETCPLHLNFRRAASGATARKELRRWAAADRAGSAMENGDHGQRPPHYPPYPPQPAAHYYLTPGYSSPVPPYPPPPQTHAYPPAPVPWSYAHRYDEPYPSPAPPYPSQSSSSTSNFHHHASAPSHPIDEYVHVTTRAGGMGSQHGSVRPSSLKVVLLHGSLDMCVHDARCLPNKDVFSTKIGTFLGNKVPGAVGTSDPYVTVQVSSATVARTYVVSNNANPVWEQHFLVPVAHEAAEVQFVVKDNDVFGAQLIGLVAIPAENLLSGERIEGVYPVLEPNGKPCAPGAVLRLSIQLIPVARLATYHHGVVAGHDVPNTYFPLRRGTKVTLYQDAHVPDGCLPDIRLDHGLSYHHGQCWRDIYDAICQARKLIYIVGWSVFHTIHLVRDGTTKYPSLGDLLKMKSQEGVRVLLLVWDDPTPKIIPKYKTDGYMRTGDEETRRFFKNSSVQVLLCPRSAGKKHSWVKQQTVDARGPREAWHDLHSRIDGPAAYDVLQNFQERWLKASKRQGIKKLAKSYDDTLLNIEGIPEIINRNDATYFGDNDPETWHVQIFRSIDSNSAKGFPKDPREATRKNLVCGKNILIDMSIHTAYVHAIRAAQHFIYIENQYFIGSSFNWDSKKDIGANNLIPIEIALKIANKIKANERFSAYIVIPMWPEGNPTGIPTQRILYWQNKTMQMMYETIYRALKEAGLDEIYEPQDYLNFFCLGNREVPDRTGTSNASNTPNNPQIYGYRMSLWAEHIGAIEENFNHPESLECMRRVRHLGEENWKQFVADDVTEMRGHLIKYPVSVDRGGKVNPLPGCTTFPDMGGNICGSLSVGIQENLTT